MQNASKQYQQLSFSYTLGQVSFEQPTYISLCLYCLIFLANDSCSNENVLAETGKNSDDSSDEDEPPEPDTTLFIKNLNFSTEQEDIREVSIWFIISQLFIAHATLGSDKMKI